MNDDRNLNPDEVFAIVQKSPDQAEKIFSNLNEVDNQELLTTFRTEKKLLVTAAQGWE